MAGPSVPSGMGRAALAATIGRDDDGGMDDDAPAWFFPGAASPEQAERYREAIVRFARDNGFPVSARRIFRLTHDVDEVQRSDEVGQVESQDRREVVVAIMEADAHFLVVTSSRGFMRGTPIPYHRDEVRAVVDFSAEGSAPN